MSHHYDHKKIEQKWQERWEAQGAFRVADAARLKENYYLLVEFPYPSGNLHVGHWYAFAVPDIFARFQRMRGRNVLFPIGFDAFGLPAENAALKRGINPRTWTHDNIAYMREQLKHMGASFDWTREVVTCAPEYYRWTQWIFLKFFKAGFAYQADTAVNWCPSCKTVLANEQVKEGKCERCESAVTQRKMKQWLLKIRDFDEELLHGLEGLPWPEEIKQAQRNWIGRSEGALIKFKVQSSKFKSEIEVFTTRPDTLFGATYVVLAPEHSLIENLESGIQNLEEVKKYVEHAKTKTELERGQLQKEKTGVELKGITAINPATKEEISIWIADYVLMGYGTGAIMAVPAHDGRDYAFAKKFNLPIREVIAPRAGVENFQPLQEAYEGEGTLINSGDFNGLSSGEAISKMAEKFGRKQVTYRLRDWLISRQRYWGCPIPIIHCQRCGAIPVPEKDLPIGLPELSDYKPRDDGKSPLAKAIDWVHVKCPRCGAEAERETDTLDTFIDSSWYFLRYTDPKNTTAFAAEKKLAAWMPINLYSGGAEHTTMHLLYSRFWIKAMHRLGLVAWDEPYTRRMNRGIILGPDGQKMSKSHGNVVDPDEQVERLGADTVRMYLAFIGPYAEVGAYPWSMNSIVGIRRFLERVWSLGARIHTQAYKGVACAFKSDALARLAHQTIKKVTEDIEAFKFNTAIAQLMTYTNELSALEDNADILSGYKALLTLLAPFAPHITEELWEGLGNKNSIFKEPWPAFDPALIMKETAQVVVQIDGKKRGVVEVPRDAGEEEVYAAANALPEIQKYLDGKKVAREVYVKGKLLNLVTQD